MSYKDDKKGKRRLRNREVYQDFTSTSVDLTREKQKARDLRKSAWWKNKISSGICHYCGRKLDIADLTMDHEIPLSRGGRSEKINLVPACKECNNKKKNLLPVEWDEYMSKIKNS